MELSSYFQLWNYKKDIFKFFFSRVKNRVRTCLSVHLLVPASTRFTIQNGGRNGDEHLVRWMGPSFHRRRLFRSHSKAYSIYCCLKICAICLLMMVKYSKSYFLFVSFRHMLSFLVVLSKWISTIIRGNHLHVRIYLKLLS